MSRVSAQHSIIVTLLAVLLFSNSANTMAAPTSRSNVTLLLPGMKLDLENNELGFGHLAQDENGKSHWTGLIGSLDAAGEKFGGVVRPRGSDLSLPRCLDRTGVTGDPRKADVFVLDYSSAADVDGLAYKTLELAECLTQLRRYTGARKVRIVGYSAGGLVARTYLQNALPKVRYAGEVDRLITIATPHLGSTMAKHFGDFLGTRASSLKTGSPLVWRLNNELELPADVHYASIVVRGVQIGSRRIHEVQNKHFVNFVDLNEIGRLPIDYQKGCDQVVNVWSQNLALTECARKFEAKHGRPIQYFCARVRDPSPDDFYPFDDRVHDVAPNDRMVIGLVRVLLQDRDDFWTGLDQNYRKKWVQWQAKNCAYGIIENAMAGSHKYSEVYDTKVSTVKGVGTRGRYECFSFAGNATSKWRLPPRTRSTAQYAGTMQLKVDKFGRIRDCRYDVAKK